MKADKLFQNDKEVGHVTSAVHSPMLNANLALGYVRREAGTMGMELKLRSMAGEKKAKVVAVPFTK